MKKKLIIVGAGISGLYLAHLLEDIFEITILEARERIGGRICSIDGHDMGPSWIWSHHTQMLELLRKLDLELFSQYTKGYALYESKGNIEAFVAPSSAPFARVLGSLSTLVTALKNSLKSTALNFAQEVRSIKEKEYQIVVETTTESFSCDYVISTLAPRLAAKVEYEPKLPQELQRKMLRTPTWMGNSAKCVIEFKKAFWKEKDLSGFVFSHSGPLGEIHDASTKTKAALFGFVLSNADMKNIEQAVKEQICRLFKIDETEILSIHLIDWRKERFTAVEEDTKGINGHPEYGIDTSLFSNKIFFSATEFSFTEGGYLEGAILQAQKVAKKLSVSAV